MAMASSSHHTFLTGRPLFPLKQCYPSKKPLLSCRNSIRKEEDQDKGPSKNGNDGSKLAKLALVAVAAGVLVIGSPQDAMAARSGGRVGGQAFRSSAPRSSGPVAPPLVGGYGYGVYGGWGWSPFTFFAPGPSVAVGIGGGFDFFIAILAFGALAAVVRRFTGRRDYEDEDDY